MIPLFCSTEQDLLYPFTFVTSDYMAPPSVPSPEPVFRLPLEPVESYGLFDCLDHLEFGFPLRSSAVPIGNCQKYTAAPRAVIRFVGSRRLPRFSNFFRVFRC